MTTSTRHRWWMSCFGTLIAVVALLAACSDDEVADPVVYFETLERAQTDLEAELEVVWEGDAATEVQAFADGPVPATLTGEQDEAVHRFIDEFWTRLGEASGRHGARLDDVGVPAGLQDLHDDYVDALDALRVSADDQIELAASTPGARLLNDFWEGTPEIEAVDGACRALVEEARLLDLSVVLPLCADG